MSRLTWVILSIQCAAAIAWAAPPADKPDQPATQTPPASAAAEPPTQPATTSAASSEDLQDLVLLVTGNNTPEAREVGAKRLLRVRSDDATRLLVDLLVTADFGARQAICRAMNNGDVPAPALLEPLLQLLGQEGGTLDADIVAALRTFDRAQVLERLKSVALDRALLIERRVACVTAIGRLGEDFPIVTALASLLGNNDERVQNAALLALQAAAGTRFADLAAAREWWEAHRTLSDRDWLLELSQRRSAENQRLRAERDAIAAKLLALSRELYQRTPAADQPAQLLKFLQEDQASLRLLGLELVNAQITDGKEIRADIRNHLVEMTGDPDPNIRLRVAGLVGDLRLGGAVARLRDAILVEPDERVRAAQVSALGRLDDPAAIPTLQARLDDSSDVVVGEAALALGLLARPGVGDQQTAASIAGALMKKFEASHDADPDLREHLIEAMGRVGAPQFRPLLRREISEASTIGIRRAAILAMAVYGDLAAAEDMRPMLEAPQPEIRLAAIQVIGRCGLSMADLAALAPCLDGRRESDPSVRRKAWDAYQEIAARLPAREQLRHAAEFALPGDQPAARRRIVLLRLLKNRFDLYGQLSPDERLRLLDVLADSLAQQNELAGEIKNIDEAIALCRSTDSPQLPQFCNRLIEASLRAGEYDVLGSHLTADRDGDGKADGAELAGLVLDALRARLDRARDPSDFSMLLNAADKLAPALRQSAGDAAAIEEFRATILRRRDEVIAGLLESLLVDPDAELRLAAFGRELVLPLAHRRLAMADAGAAPVLERRIIELASRLTPGWSGYPADATSEQKAAALAELRKAATAAPGELTTRPAAVSG